MYTRGLFVSGSEEAEAFDAWVVTTFEHMLSRGCALDWSPREVAQVALALRRVRGLRGSGTEGENFAATHADLVLSILHRLEIGGFGFEPAQISTIAYGLGDSSTLPDADSVEKDGLQCVEEEEHLNYMASKSSSPLLQVVERSIDSEGAKWRPKHLLYVISTFPGNHQFVDRYFTTVGKHRS